jgi:hypothetical protein
MVRRRVDWTNREKTSPPITALHFRFIQLLVVLGTILAVVGATKGSHDPNSPATISYVAAVFYAVTLAALVLVLLVSTPSLPLVPEAERIIVPAVALALPFIAVRVLYSLLLVFVHSGVFVRFGGPIAVRVCMALIEEFVVIAIYLFLGFRLAKLDKSEQGEILSRSWKERRRNRLYQSQFTRSEHYDPGHEQGISEEHGTLMLESHSYGHTQRTGQGH